MLLTICDEAPNGSVTNRLTLDVLTETITVREVIRSRVYQEVDEYNRQLRHGKVDPTAFRGLVTPSPRPMRGAEDNGVKQRPKEVDWKTQFEAACEAFVRNGFFVLVDDRQVEELDEIVTLRAGTQLSFVKLTPLVGG